MQKSYVRVAQAPLPLGDGGLGDEEPGGEFLLGQAQVSAALENEHAEGLFVVHCKGSFLGKVSTCKFILRICPRREKVNTSRPSGGSTVGKVLYFQGFADSASMGISTFAWIWARVKASRALKSI